MSRDPLELKANVLLMSYTDPIFESKFCENMQKNLKKLIFTIICCVQQATDGRNIQQRGLVLLWHKYLTSVFTSVAEVAV